MLQRYAGRLVTGPVAFLLAGVIDVIVFTALMLRRTARRRLRSARAR